ncbi:14299_t:CDS:1, partial [Entrophospora sp. SA101]
ASILEDDLNEDDLNVEVNENEVDDVSFSDFGNDLNIDRSLDQKLNMAIYNFHHF